MYGGLFTSVVSAEETKLICLCSCIVFVKGVCVVCASVTNGTLIL